jgi:hypothetical protein
MKWNMYLSSRRLKTDSFQTHRHRTYCLTPDSLRPHHSLVFISCHQIRHHRNLISFFRASYERSTRISEAWRTWAIILGRICKREFCTVYCWPFERHELRIWVNDKKTCVKYFKALSWRYRNRSSYYFNNCFLSFKVTAYKVQNHCNWLWSYL